MGLINRVACEIDFYDTESYAGNSYLPFIGFMCFFVGLMLLFIGIVKIVTSKHQWNIFYDQRDKQDFKSEFYVRDRKVGIILTILGSILMIVSFFIL